MITANTIQRLSTLKAPDLEDLLQRCGYKGDRVLSSSFLGITNGGQFCYSFTYPTDQVPSGQAVSKLFVEFRDGIMEANY
jgi:hypothetical protein